ncbi:MAG: phenylalanine--tRNA ligase subunit beta [Eubacteriales bacterium]
MLVSINWLKDYVKLPEDIGEFCDKMIMSGSNLETADRLVTNLEKVVVAKVEKIEKHPNADKLVVCYLNIGDSELVQVVTGAPNVFEGAYVALALDGAKIAGPFHGQPKKEEGEVIKAGELRGVSSNGMLCSFSELGFSDKVIPVYGKDGIWILQGNLKPGEDLITALDLDDYSVDFEITPNRSDCLSMIGIAREAAAVFGEKLLYPNTACQKEDDEISKYIKVKIQDKEYCKRYCARVVKNVKIEKSPWELQRKLIAAGVRPINNIVDITNFVMLEMGQPIHAFDLANIQDGKISVSCAEEGEVITTLDGSERSLTKSALLIRDGKKAVALAGIMGGLNSEIKDDTKDILIEAANFDADNVRATSKKLGLRTEASARFEKGVDVNLCEKAVNRVCSLIEEFGAGTVVSGIIDEGDFEKKGKKILIRPERINKILGTDISREDMLAMFASLEISCIDKGNEIEVESPTFRFDLNIEEDYAEEVARLYGYDNLPVSIPKGNIKSSMPEKRKLRELIKEKLCALGLNEIQTYSFCSPKSVDKIFIEEDSWERNFVKLLNPLGEETSVMRTVLTPNMLEVLSINYRRKNERVAAFEIGNTFTADLIDESNLPEEEYAISIGMYGKDIDFYVLKGIILEFLSSIGIKSVEFIAESDYPPYHPGRCARIVSEDIELGIMGETHPSVAENYDINTRVYMAELFFEHLVEIADRKLVYRPLPKYPATSRDIALVVDESIEVAHIEKIIKENGGEILEDIALFDIYRGEQIEENKKSLAFTLNYRSSKATLTDEEVLTVHEKVLDALAEKANAKLRDI